MSKFQYKLLSDAFSDKDINAGISVLKSRQLTMSKITVNFEKIFARKMGCKYAVMANSGSSANLLALSAIINPLFKKKLSPGDEVLIPAICWSTSLWPIVQNNLKPVFVDVDLDTFNISVDDLKKKITSKTKAILLIHVLGLSSDLDKIKEIAKKNKLLIIEDTCESLGAKFKGKNLGTIGDFGTYSFYYSHQITSGEGGMVVCNDSRNFHILKSLRSHGWSRGTIFHNYFKKRYKKLDERFLFINSGYNLRPTEIQAAIARSQFRRMSQFSKIRSENRSKIISALTKNYKWNNQYTFLKPKKNIQPSWFGLTFLVRDDLMNKKKNFLKFLSKNGVENRPILSGNFLNQPASKLYKLNKKKHYFQNSQKIEDSGFFIGLHTKKLNRSDVNKLTNLLLKIEEI